MYIHVMFYIFSFLGLVAREDALRLVDFASALVADDHASPDVDEPGTPRSRGHHPRARDINIYIYIHTMTYVYIYI